MTMRSADLPADDRFAWWCEQASRDTAPAVYSSPCAGDFRAEVTLARSGPRNWPCTPSPRRGPCGRPH
ncbi:hypothetical protein ABZ848_48460 [Streptomyces sp. NPDC047081]|uniref:hypothetical protein n=1 Tax=Streptomyces sp. NPDC047081 TaxID=3154706 RepID=UPI00340E8DEC